MLLRESSIMAIRTSTITIPMNMTDYNIYCRLRCEGINFHYRCQLHCQPCRHHYHVHLLCYPDFYHLIMARITRIAMTCYDCDN